jgi:methylglutaconyl-CoA hydratase
VHRSAVLVARLLEAIDQSPLVTIAGVHGAALAGGGGIMAACDFVVAADDLRIGFPEVHRGLVPALVMILLHRQLRDRDLRELVLLGKSIDARRAHAMGLVHQVVPKDELWPTALQLAEQVLQGAPQAIARTKQLLRELQPRPMSDNFHRALMHHHAARTNDEALEGIAAFLEKRSPYWSAPADRDAEPAGERISEGQR